MTCKICLKPIGMIWSRQIYIEQRPADNFCRDCFEAFVPKYDLLIDQMKIDLDNKKNETTINCG